MKKTGLAIIAIMLVSGILLTGCAKKSDGSNTGTVAENAESVQLTLRPGVLSVGVEIGYPPMEYMAEDGVTPMGFDIELGKIIAEKLGLAAEFLNTPWEGIFEGLDAGKYDCVISAVTINDARMRDFNFSKPYIRNTLAIVLHSDSEIVINSPRDLDGRAVTYQAGTTSHEYMDELAEEGLQFAAYAYDQVLNCFAELETGGVDAVMTDLVVAYEYIARHGNPVKIVWQGDYEEFGICMKKGNDALTDAVNQALDKIFQDGTLLEISYDIFKTDLVSAVRK